VTAAPVDGAANAAVCRLLAKHYGVRRSAVGIVAGGSGRTKIVEIDGVADVCRLYADERKEPPRGGGR
jgi:uncharacterized protein YggU (UPF0235/DUF167 family)